MSIKSFVFTLAALSLYMFLLHSITDSNSVCSNQQRCELVVSNIFPAER
jgi:hypothetical protein